MIRLENVLKISLQDVLKMSWRRLQNVLKTSWRCLEDVLKTSWRPLQNVLKTSWRRIGLEPIFGLDQDVLKTKANIFVLMKTKTKDVFKTSSSRRMFAGNVVFSHTLVQLQSGARPIVFKMVSTYIKPYLQTKYKLINTKLD